MANVRIKDITTTASAPNDDDYLAIDGATSGTRKILAKDLQTETDTTLSVSGKAADAMITGEEISDLKSNLNDVGLYGIIFDWEIGGIINGNNSVSTSRLRSDFMPMIAGGSIEFYNVPSSLASAQYSLALYNSKKEYLSGTTWTRDKTSFDSDGYVRVVLRKSGSGLGDFTQDEIDDYSSLIICNTGISYSEFSYDTLINTQKLNEILVNTDILKTAIWEKGSISSSGQNSNSSSVIRSNYLILGGATALNTEITNGYKWGWHFYDKNKIHVSSASAYVTANAKITVPANAFYLRCNLTYDGSASDFAWIDELSISGVVNKSEYRLDSLTDLNLDGDGDYIYDGERINLSTPDSIYHFDISVYKDYNATDFPNVSSYGMIETQSMAIYGGYIFLVCNWGGFIVLDYATGAYITSFTSPVQQSNHHNSAQFSDYFYDSNDEFPLLFVARCGNTIATEPGAYDTCFVYRITRDGTTFSATIIKEISCDITTYGNSWSVDINKRTISMVGYKNANWQTSENNPIYIFSWETPSLSEILSNSEIELKESDCIGTTEIPYVLLQACTSYAGDLYIALGSGNKQYIYKVNVDIPYIMSKVPLTDTSEVEGVTVYDGSMFVCHRKNDQTDPLTIYKLNFN